MPTVTIVQESSVGVGLKKYGRQPGTFVAGVALVDVSDLTEAKDDWTRAKFTFHVGGEWSNATPTNFATFVVPTSIEVISHFKGLKSIGWAVDAHWAEFDKPTRRILLHVSIGLKTAEILRIAYQVGAN